MYNYNAIKVRRLIRQEVVENVRNEIDHKILMQVTSRIRNEIAIQVWQKVYDQVDFLVGHPQLNKIRRQYG